MDSMKYVLKFREILDDVARELHGPLDRDECFWLAVQILEEQRKDERMAEINQRQAEKRAVVDDGTPATERQLEWLKKQGVSVLPGITKAQASKLIDEKIRELREKRK